MNTKYIAAEYRLSQWAQIMKERKETGLSIRAYCEGRGIHENTFSIGRKSCEMPLVTRIIYNKGI